LNIVIHLGLHKTGTTFFQEKIFNKIENVNLIRRYDLIIKLNKDKVNIISNENLSITPFDNKFHKGLTSDYRFIVIDRIKRLFPNAKIIIGLRKNRLEWTRSLYSEYIKSYGCLSFDNFIQRFNIESYYDFESYVDYIKKNFDNVFVYYLSDLRNNNKKIVNDVCSFIGVETPIYNNEIVNKRLNETLLQRRYFYNLISGCFNRLLSFLFGIKKKKIETIYGLNKMIGKVR